MFQLRRKLWSYTPWNRVTFLGQVLWLFSPPVHAQNRPSSSSQGLTLFVKTFIGVGGNPGNMARWAKRAIRHTRNYVRRALWCSLERVYRSKERRSTTSIKKQALCLVFPFNKGNHKAVASLTYCLWIKVLYLKRCKVRRPLYVARVSPNAFGPVSLALMHPHRALSADSNRRIMCESINLAGFSGQGFSGNSFRPTGATTAVHCHMELKQYNGSADGRQTWYFMFALAHQHLTRMICLANLTIDTCLR